RRLRRPRLPREGPPKSCRTRPAAASSPVPFVVRGRTRRPGEDPADSQRLPLRPRLVTSPFGGRYVAAPPANRIPPRAPSIARHRGPAQGAIERRSGRVGTERHGPDSATLGIVEV